MSLFDLTLQNVLTWDNSVFSHAQVGEQRVRGIESSGPVELGREMLFLPEHQASVWLAYRPDIVEGLTLSAGVRGMSSYQTDFTYLPQLRILGRALVYIGAEFDLGAVNKDFSGTKLRLNVTNLFDKEYVSHCVNYTAGGCNYGAGRAITASLKYSW